jgi:hypothetical protein
LHDMCVITGSVCQHDLCSRPIFLDRLPAPPHTANAPQRHSPLRACTRPSSEGLPRWVWRRSNNNWAEATPREIIPRKGLDTTRSLGSAMQSVLREILDCCAITLSRFIKPGKSRHERAIYHDAAITPAAANTLCLGGALACACWRWVVRSVADSVRGTTLTQELPTCASWHAIRSTEDWAPVIPTFERGDGGLGGSQPFGRMTFRG